MPERPPSQKPHQQPFLYRPFPYLFDYFVSINSSFVELFTLVQNNFSISQFQAIIFYHYFTITELKGGK